MGAGELALEDASDGGPESVKATDRPTVCGAIGVAGRTGRGAGQFVQLAPVNLGYRESWYHSITDRAWHLLFTLNYNLTTADSRENLAQSPLFHTYYSLQAVGSSNQKKPGV